MLKKHGATEQAVLETIRVCQNEDVLKAYPSEHEKEAVTIMMALFNEEYIQRAYGKEMYVQGMQKGRMEGQKQGEDRQARQTALNLRALGMDVPFIAKATGYPEETVSGWVTEN